MIPGSSARPVALITGAARRIGRAIAVELARAGFDLHLTYRRSTPDIHHTIALARQAALNHIAITSHQVDFEILPQLDALCEILSSLPRLHAIVHNASLYERSPDGAVTRESLLRHYQVNTIAPVLITQALAPLLARSLRGPGDHNARANEGGVVCISDMHVQGRPQKDYLSYALSKAALDHLVHSLARSLAPAVRVNAIAPGVLAWPDDTPAHIRAAYEARVPLARPGTPHDAASAVRWLLLEAPYITGEIIRIDGGRWLR